MQQASSRRFWLLLLTTALGLSAVLFWWLESDEMAPVPAPVVAAERPNPTKAEPPAFHPPVAGVEAARALRLSADQARRVADWIRRWEAAGASSARDEVLEEARSHEDTAVLVELILHLLDRAAPEERILGLQKLVGNSGPAQIKAFVRGLDDSDPEVRQAALQFVRDQETESRIPVFEHGLGSADPSIRSGSFQELTRENVKAAIPALMRALALTDPGIREQAMSELQWRLADVRAEPFSDAAEALRWWRDNGRRYDEHMNRID